MKIEITDDERSELLKIISVVAFEKSNFIDWEILDKLLAKLDAKAIKII